MQNCVTEIMKKKEQKSKTNQLLFLLNIQRYKHIEAREIARHIASWRVFITPRNITILKKHVVESRTISGRFLFFFHSPKPPACHLSIFFKICFSAVVNLLLIFRRIQITIIFFLRTLCKFNNKFATHL
jgi:hypothetical protein